MFDKFVTRYVGQYSKPLGDRVTRGMVTDLTLSGRTFDVGFRRAVRSRTCQLVKLYLLNVDGALGTLQDLFPQLKSSRGLAQTLGHFQRDGPRKRCRRH